MAAELVHLHVHSEYSMLDGAIRLKELVKRVAELGMPAVAVTDTGNMFGAVQLHQACQAAGVKPILGCEVNLVDGKRGDESIRDAHHLVLLAASQEGYRNLVRIVSRGWVDGLVRGLPRVDLGLLREHREGVVGLSGCMGGWLAQKILMQGPHGGRATMALLRDSFEPGCFFVELQDHGFPENRPLNEVLVELARALELPVVATNDCHYLSRDTAQAQLVLQCIGASRSLAEMAASHHKSSEMYLKSAEEMAHLFRDIPEAVRNTLRVAEMCAGKATPFAAPKLPRFAVPEGFTEETYLRKLAKDGLERRVAEERELGLKIVEADYRDRLELELGVIVKMGFPGYFLIVQDFIVWAKNAGIPVGPGRGSGAGSVVAWALRITDLDPIRHKLLFERFLNPERVSMPDFDIDFCMDKRDRVIDYVRQKYGVESVGQIATFHQLKSRSVVRDVGRVMGWTPTDAGRIATLIPEPIQGKSVPIDQAMEDEARLKQAYAEDQAVRELIDTARSLENLTRHAGMHAAGVVISEGPIWDHVPVFCPEPQTYVTQYHKDDVESAGLVKFDFLGLKTLTVLDIAVRLIDRRPDRGKEPFRIDRLPMDDKATYALLQSGETTNVFQLESSGMQSLFKQLRPDQFDDIVAAVALYRPGPMGAGMDKDYVQRKHGRVRVAYPHPATEQILKDTFGVIVYQEQVMQIARDMAGYSLGGADLLRRAMGKKKPEEMAKQKQTFLDGATAKGHARPDAEKVFELMEYFASYGFNRCVVGDTRIVNAKTGELTSVRSLFEDRRPFTVHALGPDGRLRARRVTDVIRNGRKRVFELRTAQGRRLTATGNHPLRTLGGWTLLHDLRPGDRIAAPRALTTPAADAWPVHEIITLAGLLSEGNTCHPSCLYFFNNDRPFAEDFARAISSFPATVARLDARRDGRLEVCASTGRGGARGDHVERWVGGSAVDGNLALDVRSWPRKSGAFEWARELGILGCKATEKHIPPAVFRLNDQDLELFLGRLWTGDGFIANEVDRSPFYATSSAELAEGVQALLLRLGILSGVHSKVFKYRGGTRPGYTVRLIGEGSVDTFERRLAPHIIGRDPQLALLREHLGSTARDRASKDTIPADVRQWVDEERGRAGLTWREVEARSGISMKEFYGRGSAGKRGFRRGTIARLAAFFASKRLRDLASSDLFWDRIVAIEPKGIQETFDLTVEVDHNFVAEGLVVHNSHSAAYALVTYQTAYLKAHYPVEFQCATLSADKDKSEKVVRTVAEARTMGITVLPPDVNESQVDFAVIYEGGPTGADRPRPNDQPICLKGKLRDPLKPKIRFGLGAIKGVGEAALEAVFEARTAGGEQPFVDLFDFCARVDLRRVNKSVVEALVQCGAFDAVHDALKVTRAQAFAAIEQAIERGKKMAFERESGQTSLFGLLGDEEQSRAYTHPGGEFPKVEAWDSREQLAREKATLGFYVSGHPLERHAGELQRFCSSTIAALPGQDEGAKVTVGGMVEGFRERNTKIGKMAFFHLEDANGRVEVKVFARALELPQTRELLLSGEPVLVTGTVRRERDRDNLHDEDAPQETKLMLDEVAPLAESMAKKTRLVWVRVLVEEMDMRKIEALRPALLAHPGSCPVTIEIESRGRWRVYLRDAVRVDPNEALRSTLERLLGQRACELR